MSRHALAAALIVGLSLAGCTVHAAPRAAVAGRAVVVPAGHRHDARCGHYRHHGRWYHVAAHTHRAGCGHRLERGVWVLKR